MNEFENEIKTTESEKTMMAEEPVVDEKKAEREAKREAKKREKERQDALLAKPEKELTPDEVIEVATLKAKQMKKAAKAKAKQMKKEMKEAKDAAFIKIIDANNIKTENELKTAMQFVQLIRERGIFQDHVPSIDELKEHFID